MPATSPIDAEKILRDLRHQWNELGREQQSSEGVLRACAMTLIVAAESHADAEAVRKNIGMIMHDHPSRGIILCPEEGAELSARVFAECWMPFGSHRQICSEGIEITADSAEYDEVARLLVPLLVPDLPVVLWCRGERAFLDRTLDPLFPLASKILFDTSSARRAAFAIGILRRLHKDQYQIADLAWTRLTAWREAIAHLFDELKKPPTAVRILHGGPAADSTTLYLSRWIEQAAAGIDVTLDSVASDKGIHEVTFAVSESGCGIRRITADALELRVEERTCASKIPSLSDDLLMREELSILEGDPVFERVLV